MPLTPSDIRNVTFSKPPIGKRGYNEDEVDAFLDLVGTELARLIDENNDLHTRVDQLIQQLRAAPADTGANLRPLMPARSVVTPVPSPTTDQTSRELPYAQSAKVLGMAQEIADRLTSDAKVDADRMLSQARTTTQQLLAEARAKADGLINEARSRAQTLLDDARTRAETLDRQAREQASALEREAARKHTDALSAITEEKNVLEQKIVELRAFEREYRTRLKTYLNSQLRELADPESDAHAEPQTTVLLRNAG